MSIENILTELIAAVKENTAALMSARVEAVVIENQLSNKSMLLDKTDAQRESEKVEVAKGVFVHPDEPKVTVQGSTAEVTVEDAKTIELEDAKTIEPEGDPEAIVDKASAAYGEMKDAVLAVARKDKNQAVAILAEFGIAKMTEAKNKDVSTITTKMRAALDA